MTMLYPFSIIVLTKTLHFCFSAKCLINSGRRMQAWFYEPGKLRSLGDNLINPVIYFLLSLPSMIFTSGLQIDLVISP